MLAFAFLIALTAGVGSASACSSTGFNIHATQTVNGIPGFPASHVGLLASWQSDLSGAQGTTTYFTGNADLAGHLSNSTARVPAIWLIKETSGRCNGLSKTGPVPYAGAIIYAICIYNDGPFSASPSTWWNDQSPTVTITGSGISASAVTYIIDSNGNFIQSQTGSSNGTTVIFEALSLPVAGTYYAAVMNPNSDGTYTSIGTVRLTVRSCGSPPCA